MHVSLALILLLVKNTPGTGLFSNDRSWLQTVTQDDVRVHGRDIDVIDEGLRLINWTSFSDVLKFSYDLGFDLIVVSNQGLIHIVLNV